MKVWTSLDTVSQTKAEETPPLRIVMSRSHKRDADTMFLKFLQDSEIDYELVEKGSSLKICALCDDEADMYPRFGPTSEWDIAAADAVLRLVRPSGADLVPPVGVRVEEELPALPNRDMARPRGVLGHIPRLDPGLQFLLTWMPRRRRGL